MSSKISFLGRGDKYIHLNMKSWAVVKEFSQRVKAELVLKWQEWKLFSLKKKQPQDLFSIYF